MICKIGESRQDKYTSGTINSITVIAAITAAATNTPLAASDFNPSQVNIKVTLKSAGKPHMIMQDNLQILGVFNSLKRGYHEFLNGLDKTYSAVGVKAVKIRPVTLHFGGHIRLSGNDELIVEVVPSQSGTFSSAVDTGVSHLEFYANQSIGYEMGLPSVKSEVVQQNTTNQSFNLGNNVTKLAYLNFDKNDLAAEVISNFSLSSDRLDISQTFNRLLASNPLNFDEVPATRYGSVLPIHATDATGRAFRGLDFLPQSMILFDGEKIQNELDNARAEISFNSANVAASQNYVVWTTYETDAATVKDALNRQEKHLQEKLEKVSQA